MHNIDSKSNSRDYLSAGTAIPIWINNPDDYVMGTPNLDILPKKKKRGRSYISRKSVTLDHIMVSETVFALSVKPICSFQLHLDDVLDLSWSKSQFALGSSSKVHITSADSRIQVIDGVDLVHKFKGRRGGKFEPKPKVQIEREKPGADTSHPDAVESIMSTTSSVNSF